jgi:hypothetical protein
MKRSWLVVTLICCICSGSLWAFGDEQKGSKDEYQKQTEAKLKEFKQKLVELKSKAADLKEDSKEKFDLEMTVAKKKQEAAHQQLKKLKSATVKTWEGVKAETDSAMDDFNKQYDKMMSRFRKP